MSKFDNAEKLFSTASYETALGLYSDVISEEPSNALAYQRMGQCQYQLEEYEAATRTSTAALGLNPMLPIPHTILALVYSRKGNYEMGNNEARAALALDPEAYEVVDTYGTVLLAEGQLAEAEQMLRKAAVLRPDSFRTHENLAIAYLRMRDSKKYIEQARTLFKLRPSLSNALRLLAALQLPYAAPIAVLVVVLLFLSIALRVAVLLIIPSLYAVWAALIVYRFARQRRWRSAITYFTITILYLGLLYFAYRTATQQ
jgi:tetratricopeptide (TPR) repeat protein